MLDVFSRKGLGWAMAHHLRTELVLAALNMANAQRRPQGVIHHSDKGARYTSLAFGKRCRESAVVTSPGSAGKCYDTAMAESFFATLECELINRRSFQTRAQARMVIFESLESWHDPRRLHCALESLSPNEFGRRAAARRPMGAPRSIASKPISSPCGSAGRGSTTTLPADPQHCSPRKIPFHRLWLTTVPVKIALNRPSKRGRPRCRNQTGCSGNRISAPLRAPIAEPTRSSHGSDDGGSHMSACGRRAAANSRAYLIIQPDSVDPHGLARD